MTYRTNLGIGHWGSRHSCAGVSASRVSGILSCYALSPWSLLRSALDWAPPGHVVGATIGQMLSSLSPPLWDSELCTGWGGSLELSSRKIRRPTGSVSLWVAVLQMPPTITGHCWELALPPGEIGIPGQFSTSCDVLQELAIRSNNSFFGPFRHQGELFRP